MVVNSYKLGSIVIDEKEYTHDIVIRGETIEKRQKEVSKSFREQFDHTPLSLKENIPWDCKTLVIGCGMNSKLPVMYEVKQEAAKRGVHMVLLPTKQALSRINDDDTNFILHITC
jgi:hypothetical protein